MSAAAPHRIAIDRTGRLRDEPHTGHNRWHPDVEPIAAVAAGETIVLETRDAADGQIRPGMSVEDLASLDAKVRLIRHIERGGGSHEAEAIRDEVKYAYAFTPNMPGTWTRVRELFSPSDARLFPVVRELYDQLQPRRLRQTGAWPREGCCS